MSRSLILALALSIAGSASAQTSTGSVTTTMVRTGWNSDQFALVTAEPIVNPANCAAADGYVSESTKPGYQTYLSAALMAFAVGNTVQVTVDNATCSSSGRPLLIGINVLQ